MCCLVNDRFTTYWKYVPTTPQQCSPKPLDSSLAGSSSPLHFVGLFLRALKWACTKELKSLCHLKECIFVPIRLLFTLHGFRGLLGKAVTSVVLSQWGIRGRTCTLGDKLPAVTTPSVPVHRTPALARTLIKASLHCAQNLPIPSMVGSVGLFLTCGILQAVPRSPEPL